MGENLGGKDKGFRFSVHRLGFEGILMGKTEF